MKLPTELNSIQGATELHAWFGYWPTFHDAEVVSLQLDRHNPSVLAVHIWHTTEEVDTQGYFLTKKHVVVKLVLKEISDLSLCGFNHQNVIRGLSITKIKGGYRLTLGDCFGLAGSIDSGDISISLHPGKPEDINSSL
jgi:hypothetical protein